MEKTRQDRVKREDHRQEQRNGVIIVEHIKSRLSDQEKIVEQAEWDDKIVTIRFRAYKVKLCTPNLQEREVFCNERGGIPRNISKSVAEMWDEKITEVIWRCVREVIKYNVAVEMQDSVQYA